MLKRLQDVDIRQIRSFVTVAQLSSFSKAAQHLGFTQPAVSQQIAALERAVGERVFDRPGGPRPISLTAAGEVLLHRVLAVLGELNLAEQEISRLIDGRSGRLSVALPPGLTERAIPALVEEFLDHSPDVEVRFIEGSTAENRDALVRGFADLAFSVSPINESEILCEEVYLQPYVLISAQGAHGEANGPVSTDELKQEKLIGRARDPFGVQSAEDFEELSLIPDYVMMVSDLGVMKRLVSRGVGSALVSRDALAETESGLSVREQGFKFRPKSLFLLSRAARTPAPNLDAFVEISRRMLRKDALLA